MTARTLHKLPRGNDSLQRKHLAALADTLCSEIAQDHWSQHHRDLSEQVIDQLIDRFPHCPRWASRAVDQLTKVMEGSR